MYYRKCGEFALVEEHLVLRFGLDPKLRAAAKISFKNCKLLNIAPSWCTWHYRNPYIIIILALLRSMEYKDHLLFYPQFSSTSLPLLWIALSLRFQGSPLWFVPWFRSAITCSRTSAAWEHQRPSSLSFSVCLEVFHLSAKRNQG